MATPRTPNQKKQYAQLNIRLAKYGKLVEQLYEKFNREAARIAMRTDYDPDAGKLFRFQDFPQTRDAVQKLLSEYMSDMTGTIHRTTSIEWENSNEFQDLVANKVLKAYGVKAKDGTEYERYFQANSDHLKAFQTRTVNGMNLSRRVWNLKEQYKQELEMGLSVGIEKGVSAASLAKQMKQYLNEPDKLFRRVRDKFGNLQLSKNAKAYHPGRGVYRSSYKNAMRLTRSETNMAYRTAEQTRWRQFDFVVGYEIKLSQSHPCHDVCDELAGKYPKDFVWTGWHPMDLCYCVSILKTQDEFWRDLGEDNPGKSEKEVTDVPEAFKNWVRDNEERITNAEKRGTQPYFIRDNKEYIQGILKPADTRETALDATARTPQGVVDGIRSGWNDSESQMKMQSAMADSNIREVAAALGIEPGPAMTFEEANEMRGNPDYKKGIKFRVNCQSSVLANEMRRRGFDVEAYGNTKQEWHMPSVLAKKPEIAFFDNNGELPIPKGIRYNGNLTSSLNDEMKEAGRYHLRFRFVNDGGHIITAERLPDGTLRIYDPQNGKIVRDFSEYTNKVKLDSFEYYRVDNLRINPDVAKGTVKLAKSKGDAPRMSLPEIKNILEKGWYGDVKADVAEYIKLRNGTRIYREKIALDLDVIKNGEFIKSEYYSTSNGSIFATEELPKKISKENLELSKNIQMAKKMANNGYDCYLLSNPHGTKSADFIFTKGGKVYYTEGKLSTGKNSLGHNLSKGSSQSERLLIDLTGTKDTNYIAAQLEEAFKNSDNLKDVMILKGSRLMSVSRLRISKKNFRYDFKREWEQKK